MTEPAEVGVTRVYTRQSVEDYLGAVAEKRIELEMAIARARDRLQRATELEQRVESLEQKVGEWIVLALALRRDPDATPRVPRPSPPGFPAGVLSAAPQGHGSAGARDVAFEPPTSAGAASGGALELHAVDRLRELQQHLENLRTTWSEHGSLTAIGTADSGPDRG